MAGHAQCLGPFCQKRNYILVTCITPPPPMQVDLKDKWRNLLAVREPRGTDVDHVRRALAIDAHWKKVYIGLG